MEKHSFEYIYRLNESNKPRGSPLSFFAFSKPKLPKLSVVRALLVSPLFHHEKQGLVNVPIKHHPTLGDISSPTDMAVLVM